MLPALLQCIQGPCDHHVWGEAACPLPDLCTTVGLGGLPAPSMWSLDLGHRHGLVTQQVPSAVGFGWGVTVAMPQASLLSPQHTFCRRCALKSGRALPDPGLDTLFPSWE